MWVFPSAITCNYLHTPKVTKYYYLLHFFRPASLLHGHGATAKVPLGFRDEKVNEIIVLLIRNHIKKKWKINSDFLKIPGWSPRGVKVTISIRKRCIWRSSGGQSSINRCTWRDQCRSGVGLGEVRVSKCYYLLLLGHTASLEVLMMNICFASKDPSETGHTHTLLNTINRQRPGEEWTHAYIACHYVNHECPK